jgi:hypothetical protein
LNLRENAARGEDSRLGFAYGILDDYTERALGSSLKPRQDV